MIPRSLFLVPVAAILVGCGHFPEVDAATNPATLNAPYPDLLPADTLRASVPDKVIADDSAETLEARADRLRARAARLRGTVLDSQSKARLDTQITIDEG